MRPNTVSEVNSSGLDSAVNAELKRKLDPQDRNKILFDQINEFAFRMSIDDWPTNHDQTRKESMFRKGVEEVRQALVANRPVQLFDRSPDSGFPTALEKGADLEIVEQDTNHTLYRRPLQVPLSWRDIEFELPEVADHCHSNPDACDTERGRRFMLGWAARQGVYPVNSTKRKNP